MNTKMNMHSLRGPALALALVAALPAHATSEHNGLRVVSAQGHAEGGNTVVEARISRTLANRVLSPQRLRVAIIAADGSVRSEQERLVGPAQTPRGNARDAYLTLRLNEVAMPDERLVVDWVKATF